ncbi:MAG: hypothetical protein GKS02_11645 [Alphaproteobacteria bacterium]|nr:hypothetical protein [Alphaproteobacteria bacterium]
MTICDTVQRQLAEAGIEAAEAEDIARHLEGCDDCSKFLADLRTIDAGLIELTSQDAPDALVADTLAAVRAAGQPVAARARPSQRQRWLAGGLASGAVIAASVILILNLFDPSQYSAVVAQKITTRDAVEGDGNGVVDQDGGRNGSFFGREGQHTAAPATRDAEQVLGESGSSSVTEPAANAPIQDFARIDRSLETGDFRTRGAIQDRFSYERLAGEAAQAKGPKSAEKGEAALRELDVIAQVAPEDLAHRRDGRAMLQRQGGNVGNREQFESRPGILRGETDAASPAPVASAPVGGKAKFDDDAKPSTESESRRLRTPPEAEPPRSSVVGGQTSSDLSELNKEAPAKVSRAEGTLKQQERLNSVVGSGSAVNEITRGKPAEQPVSSPKPVEVGEDEKKNRAFIGNERDGFDKDTGRGDNGAYIEERPGLSNVPARKTELAIDQLTPADRFLMAQRSLDDLAFQEPTGYWANTYIPGDPEIRLLQARLAAWDRTALGQYNRLEQDVRPGAQPFDAPADAAVAVIMASDTTAIDGPTRLRVQIGVKGAERLGGRRPAMNIGLVVDLRSLADVETGARIRALITSLERSRQPGDRFSLTVAGPAGGLLVTPEQFRHGPLQVALERMFSSPNIAGEGLSLQAAMGLATENVRAGDNPESVLGSSLVMLVTGASLEADIDALERPAHHNAVGGVPLSVVSLAGQDDFAHIDRLVAAGQGNRRILDTAQAADGLVDQELHSASRAVARALRLRIRLAPGVKLVSVLDSQRLGEPQAAQVREAEVAIDQRLARNLGIEADRGDDEQGIQMVIPNFFAGDSHTVLLDVVAERPGAIADVTVRYKDVVNLKNGVAQAALALGDTPREAGPLERNVLKNLVAVEFAKQTRLASRELAGGDFQSARQRIIQLREFVQGMRFAIPGWQSDPDLAADEEILTNYASALTVVPANDIRQTRLLAYSLRVAAHRRLQPDVPR